MRILVILSLLACLALCAGCQTSTADSTAATAPDDHLVDGLPFYNQVSSFPANTELDWSLGRQFEVKSKDGSIVQKPITRAACCPTALVMVLAKWQAVPADLVSAGKAIRTAYESFCEGPAGADSTQIPKFIAEHYPKLYAVHIDASSLKKWPPERKWKLITDAVDGGVPVIAGISSMKPRGNLPFGHYFVIKGYGADKMTIVNDPAGNFTKDGKKWDITPVGENMRYEYDDYFDRTIILVVPGYRRAWLDNLIATH